MAEEHLRQLIYSFAQKGKIEPWEFQEIQAVAQRHNVSPARMQTILTEVVNSIDYQNQPKQAPSSGTIMDPFLKTEEVQPAKPGNEQILKPFQKTPGPGNEPQWVRSEKKKQDSRPELKSEPDSEKRSNNFKVILLVILIALALYVLLGWIQPDRPGGNENYSALIDEDSFRPEELEKFYNGLYYSKDKRSKTLLVVQILNLDLNSRVADVWFQLDGESYRVKASLDFESHTIRIPKLGNATFYKADNTVIIESNDSENHWKIK